MKGGLTLYRNLKGHDLSMELTPKKQRVTTEPLIY